MTLEGDSDGHTECIGACRITNCIIWGHQAEGILFDAWDKCTLVSPVIHCTLAFNGGSSSGGATTKTIELHYPTTPMNPVYFEWDEPGTSDWLNHKVLHSILRGKSASDPVFGDDLWASGYLDADSAPLPLGATNKVYCFGLRTNSSQNYGEAQWFWSNSPAGWWTSADPPFVNGSQWQARLKENFYLVKPPVTDDFQETPYVMGKFGIPSELLEDIRSYSRPALKDSVRDTSERDKGAHQTTW